MDTSVPDDHGQPGVPDKTRTIHLRLYVGFGNEHLMGDMLRMHRVCCYIHATELCVARHL
jgi:hypothetical protein